jgi:hypothetical protein
MGIIAFGLQPIYEIIAVPETETYLYALALLAAVVVQYLRRRAKQNPLESHHPAHWKRMR